MTKKNTYDVLSKLNGGETSHRVSRPEKESKPENHKWREELKILDLAMDTTEAFKQP